MSFCRALSLLVVLLWSVYWPWTPCAMLASPLVVAPWLAVLLAGLLSWSLPPLPDDLVLEDRLALRIGAAFVGLTLASCAGFLTGWLAGEPVSFGIWLTCLGNAAGSWLAARALVYFEDLDR